MTHNMNNNPKHIWTNQQTAESIVSAGEIRNLAKEHYISRRWKRIVFSAAFVLNLAISILPRVISTGPHAEHVGWIGMIWFASLATWILGFRYYVAPRPISLNLNAGQLSGLEFYRRELLAQVDYFENKVRWLPGVILVVLAFTVNVTVDPRFAIPMVILFGMFVAITYWQWRRELPQLKSELRALDRLRAS